LAKNILVWLLGVTTGPGSDIALKIWTFYS